MASDPEVDPITAAEVARALGIRVYTIGAGIETQLDVESLQRIADITDGLYFRTEDTAGLRQIYDQINQLEKTEIEIRVFQKYEELMAWLLVPAIVLLVAYRRSARYAVYR